MTEATRELERSIRGLNWTYALIGAADATLLPYIPLYLAARHLDVLAIGLVLAVAAAGSFVAGLAWAYLADRTGKPEVAMLDPITLQRLRETSRTRYARIRLRMSGGWAISAVIAGAGYQVAGLRLM